MEKGTLRDVRHIFSYSSIIYWLCQDRITPPPPKLIQGLWENPWHGVCWEIGKVQICLSVILNNWTSPNLPLLFLLFFFFSLRSSLMLSLQALQFKEDRAAALIGCLKQHFLAEVCFYWGFFFFGWMSKDVEKLHTSTSMLNNVSVCVRKIVQINFYVCCASFQCVSDRARTRLIEQVNWLAYSLWIVNSSSHFPLFLLASLL